MHIQKKGIVLELGLLPEMMPVLLAAVEKAALTFGFNLRICFLVHPRIERSIRICWRYQFR